MNNKHKLLLSGLVIGCFFFFLHFVIRHVDVGGVGIVGVVACHRSTTRANSKVCTSVATSIATSKAPHATNSTTSHGSSHVVGHHLLLPQHFITAHLHICLWFLINCVLSMNMS
uniref:Predicted protein n=1 Tax=Hordeum vulgare subsp. vulgare TaxID=112509 RepID=F2DP91_HORVV|nr:predicted protein [Hordeum vulgare subsp. vulgare]